jgi:hypothetical protein
MAWAPKARETAGQNPAKTGQFRQKNCKKVTIRACPSCHFGLLGAKAIRTPGPAGHPKNRT